MNRDPHVLESYKGIPVQPVVLVREPETPERAEFPPQRVTVISNHIGMLQMDSRDRVSGQPWAFTVNFSNYTRGIKRIALNFVQLWNTIPNINVKNNVLVYFDNGDATFKTATLTPGFYNLTQIATELQTALNASVPPPVAPFTVTSSATQYNLNVTNVNSFFFDQTSSFMVRGVDMCDFPFSNVLTTSLTSNVCKLLYTNYFVLTSNELVNYSKNVNVSSNPAISNIVGLVSLDDGTYPHRRTAYYSDKQWINFFPSTQITNLNMRILDQYGEDPVEIALGDPHIEIEIYTQL